MNRQPEQQGPRSGRSVFGKMILKGLFLYALVPALLLIFLAQPVSAAVRGSGSAAFPLLLAALGVVCLNWFVYAAFHRRRPSLLVFAHGVFCLFAFLIVEYAALPPTDLLTSSLADIGGCLVFAHLFLFSFWLASCRSKFAHSAAVVIWVIIGIITVFMVYRIWRDFEARTVTRDTWINIAILVILCPVPFAYRIRASVRRAAARRRASVSVAGRIVQIIGETRLDRDDELVTDYYARVQYSVGDIPYETRTSIAKSTVREFGRKVFVGREIPVFYDPEKPGDAVVRRIDWNSLGRDWKKSAGENGQDRQDDNVPAQDETVSS